MIKWLGKEISISLIRPPIRNYPVTLFSEQVIGAQVQSHNMKHMYYLN